MGMAKPRTIDHRNCWTVSGVRSAEKFFRAIPTLVPEATDMFLEGSSATEIVALLAPFSTHADYGAPVGTLWSWPREQRFSVKASPALLASLSEAADHHANRRFAATCISIATMSASPLVRCVRRSDHGLESSFA
jgi:hypothetical protein